MRRPLIISVAVAVAVALGIGLAQTGGAEKTPDATAPTSAQTDRALAGAPPALAAIHRDANKLLPAEDFAARINSLRGHPIVVNVWGSWCVPCRQEFPIFERVSVKLGKRVAFIGVATQDAEEAAAEFLASSPVAFPSYLDFDGKIARQDIGSIGTPSTLYYNAKGDRTFLHQGPYLEDADLVRDIERYTGD